MQGLVPPAKGTVVLSAVLIVYELKAAAERATAPPMLGSALSATFRIAWRVTTVKLMTFKPVLESLSQQEICPTLPRTASIASTRRPSPSTALQPEIVRSMAGAALWMGGVEL